MTLLNKLKGSQLRHGVKVQDGETKERQHSGHCMSRTLDLQKEIRLIITVNKP